MAVRVRFAPSPTGFLHIGGVHTALFNWLFSRHEGGDFHLRIENTDTSREVAEATQQIQDSLSWIGLDWDGEVTFQLDRMERCREEAARLVAEGKAYEDEGAIRMRMPEEGVTAWDDLIRGRIEWENERLDDLVIVRGDGRPTYNFASPVEDWLDGITHVLRGDDHVSNTPRQIRILEALGAPLPAYGHVANILGPDGKKLSKRHGATSVEEFRAQGYIPEALVNFLALLGWSYDDKTTVMSREELVERFTLERVGASPSVFDFQKLDWLNGVYLRALPPPICGSRATNGTRSWCGRSRRSSRRRSRRWASSLRSPASSSRESSPTASRTGRCCPPRPRRSRRSSPSRPARSRRRFERSPTG
jgi:glutamyl/glutaminyl-tRNA synthetase